MIGDLMST